MSGPSAAPRRGPGRPADGADRRTVILDVAREQFAAKGYNSASVRGIAREADVDPALVHHYFSTKQRLFVAAMQLPFDPTDRLPEVLDGPRDELGERLARFFLGVWSDPAFRAPMLGLIRSAVSGEDGARLLREFLGAALLGRLVGHLGPVDPVRVQAAGAQLVGAVILRHVIRIEPWATIPDEDLVAVIGPTVQRYLFGGPEGD